MADVEYKPDFKGTGALMRCPEMSGAMELVAHEAIPFAKSISPDAPPYGEGYIASFHVEGGLEEKTTQRGGRRATAHLVNDSDHALVVEVGVGQQMGHHVLSRVIDHIERP